ncbi:MAG: beta-N-acetylglucosaminidase [Bacteroides sp. SM23_62]|nr:MAG: beta-N-acetylglucosaminidase [Bacteroides sp. SM23_62]
MKTANWSMIFILAMLASGCQPKQADLSPGDISILPKPVHIKVNSGLFEITKDTKILVDPEIGSLGEMLSTMLSPSMGFALDVSDGNPVRNSIRLSVNPSLEDLGEEGYRLTADKNRVLIEAPAGAGVFYGMQTLRQLLPAEVFGDAASEDVRWTIPCVEIKDYPRFKWRGMHLDVCRHFMPVEFVKKYIDLIAIQKMNRFHWHLTEDQGWRIDIRRYPKLAEISAWRDETLVGHYNDEPRKFDGQPHGGFYTHEEIREVVAYANGRYVTIVPEIEMPGHSQAALAAYPEISCTGGPFKVSTIWGIRKEVYCAGNEKTFEFLENVLREVLELFPGEYIHVGGDECPKDRWEECQKCQDRIRQEGLQDEHELQSYFIKRMEKFLHDNNRRLIGWDEILEGGLAPNAAVMSWRGEAGGIAAARLGHDVVMAPYSHTYFDYYQADPQKEPLAIGGLLPIDTVYAYDPVPAELDEQQQQHILGVQGQVWTEYIPTPEKVEYMAFPRACALAETAWTPADQKDYETFTAALLQHLKRLDFLNVNYRKL